VFATPIGDGEAAAYVAGVISSALTAPVFPLAVSIMYFDLGGGVSEVQPPGSGAPPSVA
jgi:hypothetical protein